MKINVLKFIKDQQDAEDALVCRTRAPGSRMPMGRCDDQGGGKISALKVRTSAGGKLQRADPERLEKDHYITTKKRIRGPRRRGLYIGGGEDQHGDVERSA